MLYPPSLSRLIEALRCLPGVGPKSAQRMAFHLLERERDGGRELAQAVTGAMDGLGHCRRCRMFAEGEATAHFLGEVVARHGLPASRIAHGVPVGGELDYLDEGTLAAAIKSRRTL